MKFLKQYWWFIALLLVCALILFIRSNKSSVEQFSVSNIGTIDGFSIIKGADSITIHKAQNGWEIDNGQVADVKAVNSLFNVLRNINTESPVPSKLNDSLVDVTKNKGVQVIVYSKGSEKLNFSVLFENNFKKTICVEHNSDKVFFVELVDFTGQIADLFITDKSYWTGNQLFSFPISKVFRVEVDFPQNPELSYIICIGNGSFDLLAKATNENLSSPNIDRLSHFISGLGNLSVTKLPVDKQNIIKDEFKLIQPMRVITLYSDAQSSRIVIYPIKVDKINELGVKVEFDPNHFYVVYADNQIAEGTYVNFSSVLWDIADLVIKN
ncbi:hypothetical protein CYCD_23470 [Tenuifilaceae bacterium CYCD]|nr:hypothetical protein CYCD_23470 [Tenuifilaceae bacterium CYCD]